MWKPQQLLQPTLRAPGAQTTPHIAMLAAAAVMVVVVVVANSMTQQVPQLELGHQEHQEHTRHCMPHTAQLPQSLPPRRCPPRPVMQAWAPCQYRQAAALAATPARCQQAVSCW